MARPPRRTIAPWAGQSPASAMRPSCSSPSPACTCGGLASGPGRRCVRSSGSGADWKGKARDFNWHNTIGFWSLPVLVVLTASGMVMSYKWASDLIFKLTGNEPPANGGPFAQAPVKVPEPSRERGRSAWRLLFAEARERSPAWRPSSASRRRAARQRSPWAAAGWARGWWGRGRGPGGESRGGGRQALTFSIREQGAWPLFASAQVSLDPFTGQVLRRETFADYNSGRRIRTWLRFLHTGEALGWPGQLVAGLASLGAAVLLWTGFALSWRRFFRRGSRVASAEASIPTVQPVAVQPERSAKSELSNRGAAVRHSAASRECSRMGFILGYGTAVTEEGTLSSLKTGPCTGIRSMKGHSGGLRGALRPVGLGSRSCIGPGRQHCERSGGASAGGAGGDDSRGQRGGPSGRRRLLRARRLPEPRGSPEPRGHLQGSVDLLGGHRGTVRAANGPGAGRGGGLSRRGELPHAAANAPSQHAADRHRGPRRR